MPGAPKPPAAPGAPPPPAGPKSKEEIEQEVEREIRQRKEQEQKLEGLDEKVTAISDQMEGLTKTLNRLVNVLQKDVGEKTDFEEKFDELKDEEEEDLSSSDFGLGKEERLVRSNKEEQMSTKEQLRAARKDRVAKELTFEMKEMPNKKYKQQVPAPTITKLKDEPEDWGQYRLKAVDMAMDLNAAGTEWAVVNKHTDQVFYKIQPTAETKEVFASREFAEAVINDVREMGLEAAMEKYSALPFELKKEEEIEEKPSLDKGKPDLLKKKLMDKDKKKPFPPKKGPPMGKEGPPVEKKGPPIKELEEEACAKPTATAAEGDEVTEPEATEATEATEPEAETPEFTEEMPTEATEEAAVEETPAVEEPATDTPAMEASFKDNFVRRFVRAFRLALSAQAKNLADNPLKAAWYETLNTLGVDEPEKIIEATFERSAAEHFEVTLAKAAEYLEMNDESFIDLEAQIGELNTATPITASEAAEAAKHERAASLRARAHRSSLPLSSASDTDPGDATARLQQALPKPKLHGISKLK
jgi:hypothetical protein